MRATLAIFAVLALYACGAAGLELQGAFVQGGLLVGRAAPGTTVSFDGQPIRVSPEGVFLLGFGRDEPARVALEVTSVDGSVERRVLEIAPREWNIQRIDGLPERKVSPDPATLARIAAEATRVREARETNSDRTDFLHGFVRPAKGRTTGVYGSQRILNGKPRSPHYGLDIAAPVGAPVIAPAAGVVTFAAPDLVLSGGTLIVDHGHGLSSSFLHLSRILVSVGSTVEAGQIIAEVGATGRATGAHLDWRMNLFTRRIDPALLLEAHW